MLIAQNRFARDEDGSSVRGSVQLHLDAVASSGVLPPLVPHTFACGVRHMHAEGTVVADQRN